MNYFPFVENNKPKNGISRSVVDEKKSHYSSQEKKLIETEWDEECKKKRRSSDVKKEKTRLKTCTLSFNKIISIKEQCGRP